MAAAADSSIEEQLLVAERLRGEAKAVAASAESDAEARALRAEKRMLRDRALRDKARERRFVGVEDPAALKRHKAALMLPKKGHACRAPACRMLSLEVGAPVRDPYAPAPAPTYRSKRKVFVCASTGAAHLCEPGRCNKGLATQTGEIVCQFSGVQIGLNRLSAATPWRSSEDRGVRGGFAGGDRRPRGWSAHERRTAGGGDRDAYDHNLAADASGTSGASDADGGGSSSGGGGGAARKRPAAPPPPSSRAAKKRSKSAHAQGQRLLRAVLAGEASAETREQLLERETAKYGRTLIAAELAKATKPVRELALALCRRLLCSDAAAELMDARLLDAEAKACRRVADYLAACKAARVAPSRDVAYSNYWQAFEPLLDRAYGMARMRLVDARDACAYFAEATVAVWRIICSAPLARESGLAQFKTVAVGILYLLKDGLRCLARFDRRTRRTLTAREIEAMAPEERARHVEERYVWFVPAHDALRCLPSNGDIDRLLRAPASPASGPPLLDLGASVMISQGTIKNYYHSVLASGLTIDQVDDYCLDRYLEIVDLDAGARV